MKAIKLNEIQELYFSTADIGTVLNISLASARVAASRYAKQKIIIRLKRDLYMLASRIESLKDNERFRIANMIQTPSYISLTSALSYHGVTTQQQQNFIESIALKRTKLVSVNSLTFSYTRIKEGLYDGFDLRDDFFIASAEKALVDALYLTSIGRYSCDFYAINFRRIEKKQVMEYIKRTNRITKNFWKRLCENFRI